MTRTVLVTGSSRGLGAVIVKTLATQGVSSAASDVYKRQLQILV